VLAALARLLARHPRRALALVVLAVAVAAVAGAPVADRLNGGRDGLLVPGSESAQAAAALEAASGRSPSADLLALVGTPAGAGSPEGRRAIAEVAAALRAERTVAAVTRPGGAPGEPLVARDGRPRWSPRPSSRSPTPTTS